jgi:alanyl-tRNA synthetase
MHTAEIRRRFLDHFEKAGHTVVPSAPLLFDDPNLLFVNAGMVPFKPYFLGQETPPWNTATSVQKCVRTLDIEEVGKTTRHGTFFQMNGNFSFGDYFKEGAITHAWRLITGAVEDGGLGIDADTIWVTVLHTDQEAREIWRRVAGLPDERIQDRGLLDNYWHMGVPGPGGPCSEIYVDRGPEFGPDGGPVVDEDRFLEIWNLVFMQEEITNEQEHRHRHGARARRLPAAGQGQPVRDRRGLPGHREGVGDLRSQLRQGPRRRRAVPRHRRPRAQRSHADG